MSSDGSQRPEAEAPAPITPSSPRRRSPRPREGRPAATLLLSLLLVAGAAVSWVYQQLQASLPTLDGTVRIAGLGATVTVTRDALGVPTIRGRSRSDVALALGFVHAQDRFFQMDLLRRQAAGELAELLGESLLDSDRRLRVHRFRARAEELIETFSRADQEVAEAYCRGVAAGLQALSAPPFEYLILRARPRPWAPEDILLAAYSLYLDLHDEQGRFESARGLVADLLGPQLLDFLAPLGTEWDAPVDGEPYTTPSIPGPEVLDLRERSIAALRGASGRWRPLRERPLAGSNNWALSGKLTAHGGAVLANDMHLGLAVPNTWYRASLVYPDASAPDGDRRVTGVTLPGTPFLVAGSNGQVAWGYTNTYGDWEDLVILETSDGQPDVYLTAEGPRRLVRVRETLVARGGRRESLEVLETLWGPVIDEDHRGRRRALRWIAHDPEAVSFAMLDLERTGTVEEAVAVAHRIGAPPQNFVVADAAGRIAWTVMGPIPRRFGHDGRVPTSWADGRRGWQGYLEPPEYPRLFDPPSGRLWTANSRVVGGEAMRKIGLGTYPLGARARQIREGLMALDAFTEHRQLALQLDDRAAFLQRWQGLLLRVLTTSASETDPRRLELRQLVETWGGRAAVDSAGYRMVRAFRLFVAEQVLGTITAACKQADARFDPAQLLQLEGPLWRLVEERPTHLLDPRFETWDEQLQGAIEATLDYFLDNGGRLAEHTWGARNQAAIRHVLSPALPFASRWLDMPADPLPGDEHMPRFQGPSEGASQRLVVSPGREEHGIFHMPAGQSGHPLSPHYRDGHAAWVHGESTAFLPGPAVNRLTLEPVGAL